MPSEISSETCGYCNACIRTRLMVARGRRPEPLECAYKHILESYSACAGAPAPGATAPPACSGGTGGQNSPGGSCCRWTSDAQFPELPSSGELSLEWGSQSPSPRHRRRRRR